MCRPCAWSAKLARFGITEDDYHRMEHEQEGMCAICDGGGRMLHLVVDHDHRTGAVRGLLCRNCNAALGGFHDGPDLLRIAAHYLDTATDHRTILPLLPRSAATPA